MTTPAAPVLSADGKHVKASFDAPKGSINAVIYLSSAKGKQFYDAENEMLLKVGQTGKVIKLTGNAKKSVHITNLEGDLEYTATIAFRGADDFDWGPTSPASAPLTIVPPVAPQAPLLEAVSKTSIKVIFVAPPHCLNINMIFHDGKSEQSVQPDLTFAPYGSGCKVLTSAQSKRPSIVIMGLSDKLTYKVALVAYNGCWGPRGPWSEPLKLSDHPRPAPPCAPFLSNITQDSVRVSFSLLADCPYAMICFKRGTTTMAVDSATNALVAPGTGRAVPASKGKDGFVVSSLLPDTAYEVSLSTCYQGFTGFPSKSSPSTEFRTLPAEVEITGTKTQEERDAELRKNAVDVDAEPPKAKRAKK